MAKEDSGVSVVIIFVMILAVFAIVVAIWAVLGVPGQLDEINYQHSFKVENGFADYQSMLYSMFDFDEDATEDGLHIFGQSGSVNVAYSLLLPVGTPSSAGSLQLKQNVGQFSGVNASIETHTDTNSFGREYISIDRLSVTFGRDCEIGIEGGGVFRRDGNSAHWIIRPLFDSYYGDIMAMQFTDANSIHLSTNSDVSLTSWYTGKHDIITDGITYTSADIWDVQMWQNYFYELHASGNSIVPEYPAYSGGDSFTITLPYGITSPEFGIMLTPVTT